MTGDSSPVEGWKCPECGNEARFRIKAEIWCVNTEEGFETEEETAHEMDFGLTSPVQCLECHYESDLAEFMGEDEEAEAESTTENREDT